MTLGVYIYIYLFICLYFYTIVQLFTVFHDVTNSYQCYYVSPYCLVIIPLPSLHQLSHRNHHYISMKFPEGLW